MTQLAPYWSIDCGALIVIYDQVTFLKSVPLLSTFPADILAKISDVLELEVYKKGKTNRHNPAV